MKVSVFVATSGRPFMFEEMLKSLKKTTKGMGVEIIAVIDADPVAYRVARDMADLIDYGVERRGALWAWNRALGHTDGEYLIAAGDDQIFHANWLEYALESHQTHCKGFGVVGMNDLAYDGNKQLATMFLFDRQYCKEVMGGIFAPPMYHYYCIDSEWNAKAKSLGHFYWDERAVVEHLHSSHGKRPVDDLDREKMDAGWMEVDNKTFEDRKEKGFPITWTSLL